MRHSPGPAPTLNIRPDFSCPKSWDPQEKTPSQISQEILPKPVQQIAPENCVDSQARILFFERRTMSTQAQIAANQKNSQNSTGPKSETGKAVSCRNNFRHGFTGAFGMGPCGAF